MSKRYSGIESPGLANRPYWGFWATLAFALIIFIIFSIIQMLVFAVYGYSMSASNANVDFEIMMQSLSRDGTALSLAEIPSALAGTGMVILFASLRRNQNFKQYLELNPVSLKTLLKWSGIMIAMIVFLEIVNFQLQREIPDFMSLIYESADNQALLWFAIVICAPLFEEFLFRGLLLEGFRHTMLGNIGAIVITSAAWAVIHMQYEWFEIGTIFLIGILLAIAKLKTQSLYVPITMHALMNLSASIMMYLLSEEALSTL